MASQRSVVTWVTIAAASLAIGAAGCSSSGKKTLDPSTTTSTALVGVDTTVASTSTTVAATTTTIAATTTSTLPPTTTSTTTTLPPTTTTTPPGASLPLRFDGVGDARFGTEPEDVVDYVTSVLGAPTADSGWVDAPSRTCPGSEVRFVEWIDLTLLFSDDSSVSSGRRHFFAWSLSPEAGTEVAPAGMKTLAGIGIGSTVVDVRAAYPEARFFDGDEVVAASVSLSDDLFAFLSDTTDAGVVTALLGGQGCGE